MIEEITPLDGAADFSAPLIERVALAPSAYAPHRGGVEEVAAQLGKTLSARGVEVDVTTMRWPKSLPRTEVVDGLSVRRQVFRAHLGGARRRVIAAMSHPVSLAALIAYYRSFKPDLVNIHCVSPAAQFHLQACKILRIPLVVSVHGELTGDATGLYQREPKMRAILRSCLAHADAVTACSQVALDEVKDWYEDEIEEPTSVVHNGVDVSIPTGVPPQQRRNYLFAVGRHAPQKGFDVLIDAFANANLGDSGVDLIIAGEGSDTELLRAQVRECRLNSYVQFVGPTNRLETAEFMRGALAVAMPSRREAFGIVALEAMAAGVPLIASRVGGIPEFVTDGENGLLVPPDDVSALADALKRITADASLGSRLAASGASTVRRLSWEHAADNYQRVYSAALEHAAATGKGGTHARR